MPVETTISFSESTFDALGQVVPKSRMSSFVDHAVVEALRQVAKEKAIEALENFPRVKSSGKPVVETLRDVRKQESSRLMRQ